MTVPAIPVPSRVHLVAVLVTDGVGLAELGQVEDVFRVAAEIPGAAEPRYEVTACAPAQDVYAAEKVTTSASLEGWTPCAQPTRWRFPVAAQ